MIHCLPLKDGVEVRAANPSRYICTVLPAMLLIACSCAGRSSSPNVVLIIIDTLRADHLGCYGYSRNTSPTIDSLAAAGILVTDFQAQSSWTLPSHASIWTGLTPVSHGARRTNNGIFGVSPELPTFASVLHDNGWITLGFVNVGLIGGNFGFSKGFDHYSACQADERRAADCIDDVTVWFEENRGNPYPKLLVVHLFDVHDSYDPPAPYDTLFCPRDGGAPVNWSLNVREWWEHDDIMGVLSDTTELDGLLGRYDGEIAYVDAQLSLLFARLREYGMMENTIVILTSDHGEEFLDHEGIYHGHTFYQEILHVPMIISGPGIPEGFLDTIPAGHVDIMPTILAYAGLDAPAGGEGENLLGPRTAQRSLFSSGLAFPIEECYNMAAVLCRGETGIINFGTGTEEMFFLPTDPDQQTPLEISDGLREQLDSYWSTPPRVSAPEVGGAEDEVLKDLGYI